MQKQLRKKHLHYKGLFDSRGEGGLNIFGQCPLETTHFTKGYLRHAHSTRWGGGRVIFTKTLLAIQKMTIPTRLILVLRKEKVYITVGQIVYLSKDVFRR